MGQLVVTGAMATCTMGMTPCPINVTSQLTCVTTSKPTATIQDMQPMVNMAGFGMCKSLLNPQVAAATAAAWGVLTPQPCVMMPAGTWIPTKPNVTIGGKPCLTSDCKLMCTNGMGQISITNPGQVKGTVG